MNISQYKIKDPRLERVDELARSLYNLANLELHNYDHALWDTKKIIVIGESEGHKTMSLPIAAGLMHDTGVSLGPYKDHTINGGKNVRGYLPRLGFNKRDTEEVAVAVEEHNGLNHTSNTSKLLYDADTLNKAGAHGLGQCLGISKEFGLDLNGMKDRFLPYFDKIVKKGFYTDTAREINRDMGNSKYAGLELMLEFWKKTDELLRNGNLNDTQIMDKLREDLNIGYEL